MTSPHSPILPNKNKSNLASPIYEQTGHYSNLSPSSQTISNSNLFLKILAGNSIAPINPSLAPHNYDWNVKDRPEHTALERKNSEKSILNDISPITSPLTIPSIIKKADYNDSFSNSAPPTTLSFVPAPVRSPPPPALPIPVKGPPLLSREHHNQTAPPNTSNFSWIEQTKKAEDYVNWNKLKSGESDSGLSFSQANLENHKLAKEFEEKYTLEHDLGMGATAFVMSATQNDDGKEVAVKFIFKERILITDWVRDRSLGIIPREIFMLKQLKHKNIVKFLDAYEDLKFFYLVMESATSSSVVNVPHPVPPEQVPSNSALLPSAQHPSAFGISAPPSLQILDVEPNDATLPRTSSYRRRLDGSKRISRDLFETIQRKRNLPESEVRHIFVQVVDAIDYLHNTKNMVHRDIKDENIIVEENLQVKLIDFGAASIIPSDPSQYFEKYCGTAQYASPEIIRGERYRGPPQDIWALGVLLYVLCFGSLPFPNSQAIVLGKYVRRTDGRSEECLEVISKCFCVDVGTRWTISDMKNCVWFQGR
ncbi:hypothetical protein HK098_002634 [Nowakowskiella sp. JEL0407]|nr:hypothetical protein HK098_002634 [Nowakowskiella sp. JEL0407]